MDASRFDRLARALGAVRTRRSAATVVGAVVLAPWATPGHVAGKRKKRKKKCAKKCQGGCCTGKFGKCIQPADQSAARCGSGGQTCHGGCPECTADRPCPTGTCCRRDGTCGACLVFVTSSAHNGNLGGLAGADATCQRIAGNAGLPGTFMAWLSTSTQSPISRFTRASVPYTLVDDTPIAANWADLVDATLAHAINKIETGGFVDGAPDYAWTNTGETGAPGGLVDDKTNCLDWMSAESFQLGNTGRLTSTNFGWTFSTADACNIARRLYCFQQR